VHITAVITKLIRAAYTLELSLAMKYK